MVESLLTTKLHIPARRPEFVQREPLLARLEEGLRSRLILVSAPAGYGKTTLLSAWVERLDRPVAWLSLDEADNDTARFLSYLVAALQTIEPETGAAALTMIQSPQPAQMQAIQTVLVNEIVEIAEHFVLILDDYHLIHAQAVHDTLAFLLEHQLPHMTLVVATRADPPLPLPHLRGRGELLEIRQADLRFTAQEAAQFLLALSDVSLSKEEIADLTTQTEGWAAGLQMAALSLRRQDDVAVFVKTSVGSNRYILDYLIEEVFKQQSEIIQSFLLQTAILDQLTADLCNAVTGRSDGYDTLVWLERSNLFVVPLDDSRHRFRYHRLFSDLLRQRLERTQPDTVPELHLRACEWYERNGWAAAAIKHALAAGAVERAANLIEREAKSTLMRSETVTLLRWIDMLPDDMVRDRPVLGVYHAYVLLLGGHPLDTVMARLQAADEASPGGEIAAEAAALRGVIAAMLGDAARSLELSHRALGLLPEHDFHWRSMVTSHIGMAHVLLGNFEQAIAAYEESVRLSQTAGNVMVMVGALSNLAGLCHTQGQLHRAQTLAQQALDLATTSHGEWLPVASRALLILGELAREWNELEAAERYFYESLDLFKQYGDIGVLMGYLHLARVKQAQGHAAEANELLQTARQIALKSVQIKMDDLIVEVTEARLWLQQGNLQAVSRWIHEQGLEQQAQLVLDGEDLQTPPTARDLRESEYTLLARVSILQRRYDEALALLKWLQQEAQGQGRTRRLIEAQNLEAVARWKRGDESQALAVLEQALILARPEGYVRLFVDEGTPMAQLLYEATVQGIAADYAGRLLAAFPGGEPESAAQNRAADTLVEPLTERELEVLQLVASGSSNQEIANELVISIYTVKKHITNILGKLAVSSRTQAAAYARELGLIE